MKLDTYTLLALTATFSFVGPLLFVAVRNSWRDHFFTLFALYWATGALINLPDLFPVLSPQAKATVGAVYNMFDLIFILTILYVVCNATQMKRFILAGLIVTVALEVTGIALNGFVYDSLRYAIGTGILLILITCTWEVLRYLRRLEPSARQTAKILVYAAVLFEYGTFIVIYVFDYFVKTSSRHDTYLIYYCSTIVSMIIACFGYQLAQAPVKPTDQ